MTESNNQPVWMQDEMVKDIPKDKLIFLESILYNSKGKNKQEMISYTMTMLAKAKKEKLTFTKEEMATAIAAIKKYSSEEEIKKMDSIIHKANIHH